MLPFESVATATDSPSDSPAGSLRKLGTDVNGMSGTPVMVAFCCALVSAADSRMKPAQVETRYRVITSGAYISASAGSITMSMRIECVLECGNHLGEGPVWDVEQGCLYWVDGTGRRVGNPSIWRLDPRSGRTDHWPLTHDVGALALRANGGAVLALDDGFYFFDFTSGQLKIIAHVDVKQPRTRLNDGKCDRRGRFFAGGMDDKEELAICGLWRLDPDLSVTKVDDGIICSNGPCWSPDDRIFYF